MLVPLNALGDLASVQRRDFIRMQDLESIMAQFGTRNRAEQLMNGAIAARDVLLKYTSTLAYDRVLANALFDKIEAWQRSNGAVLQEAIRRGATTIPQQVAIAFGPGEAAQFIVASFSEAVRGLYGWESGVVASNYKVNPKFTEADATSDAENRLVVFAQIVKLDREGQLKNFFATAEGTSGLGITGLEVALVVFIVAVIAGLVVLADTNMKLNAQNENMEKLCADQSPEGKAACLEARKAMALRFGEAMGEGLEAGGLLGSIGGTIAKYAVIGVVAYLGLTVGVPALRDALKKKAGQA